jgi:hypothetical protein
VLAVPPGKAMDLLQDFFATMVANGGKQDLPTDVHMWQTDFCEKWEIEYRDLNCLGSLARAARQQEGRRLAKTTKAPASDAYYLLECVHFELTAAAAFMGSNIGASRLFQERFEVARPERWHRMTWAPLAAAIETMLDKGVAEGDPSDMLWSAAIYCFEGRDLKAIERFEMGIKKAEHDLQTHFRTVAPLPPGQEPSATQKKDSIAVEQLSVITDYARVLLGNYYAKSDRWPQARPLLEKAAFEGDNPNAYCELGFDPQLDVAKAMDYMLKAAVSGVEEAVDAYPKLLYMRMQNRMENEEEITAEEIGIFEFWCEQGLLTDRAEAFREWVNSVSTEVAQ